MIFNVSKQMAMTVFRKGIRDKDLIKIS
uniref:Uncharacterized protein n=1 Tax=Arundo donax TaxID=35708 RepID=A0A0A9AVY8_ARUDO